MITKTRVGTTLAALSIATIAAAIPASAAPAPAAAAGPSSAVADATPTSEEGAPKPGASSGDWMDYVLGNPTPPIRPKG